MPGPKPGVLPITPRANESVCEEKVFADDRHGPRTTHSACRRLHACRPRSISAVQSPARADTSSSAAVLPRGGSIRQPRLDTPCGARHPVADGPSFGKHRIVITPRRRSRLLPGPGRLVSHRPPGRAWRGSSSGNDSGRCAGALCGPAGSGSGFCYTAGLGEKSRDSPPRPGDSAAASLRPPRHTHTHPPTESGRYPTDG